MIIVSATDLRLRLKECLDKLEEGEEIRIVRNSAAIGRLVPSDEVKAVAEMKQPSAANSIRLPDDSKVQFRQYGPYEPPELVQELYQSTMRPTDPDASADAGDGVGSNRLVSPKFDLDMLNPGAYYPSFNGEFWVGELDDQLVAMGAFQLDLTGADAVGHQAELKRMRVRPDMQGQGIGTALLRLLEARARQHGYRTLTLDTIVGLPAQGFYEQQGYHETRRERETDSTTETAYYHKTL